MTEGLIKPAAHVQTKAACERPARHRGELPDAFDAEPAEGIDSLDREAKRANRQFCDCGCHSPGDDNALGSMTSHGPSCAGRVRDSRPTLYARPPQTPLEVIQK